MHVHYVQFLCALVKTRMNSAVIMVFMTNAPPPPGKNCAATKLWILQRLRHKTVFA